MNNRIVLDRDVLLDMAVSTRSRHKVAIKLLDTIEQQSIQACVCASELPFVLEGVRDFMDSDAPLYMKALVEAFDVLPIDEAVCKQALGVVEGDLTIAMLQVCAEKVNADYIITNDPSLYKRCSVKAIDAAKFLQLQ